MNVLSKNLTILFIFASISFSTLAQPLKISSKWGEDYKSASRASLSDIIGHDATGLYVVRDMHKSTRSGGTAYKLEHIDNNFMPTNAIDLEIEEGGKQCIVEQFLQLKSRLYVFYSLKDKKEKKNTLYVDEIDKTTLLPKMGRKMIGVIDYEGSSNRNSGSFDVSTSRDSSKLLVLMNTPYVKGDPESFRFNVLDASLTSLWEREITIPYKDGLFGIESIRVDNDGNAYLLGMQYKEKRKAKRNGHPNYTYEVFAYLDKGNTTKQYTISLDDRFITDMAIEILNGNIVCAGFYSKTGTFSIRGTYFLTVDAVTKEIKTKSFKEFDIDFLVQNLTEKQARKAVKKEEKGDEQELYEYDLHRLLIGKDGSAVLVGEQFYVKVVTSTYYANGVPHTSSSTYYYYNDIIAVKIDPAGQILWAEKIGKRQRSVNDGGYYASYKLVIAKGRICFIYNDSPENLAYTGKGAPKDYNRNKSVVIMVSLDTQGKQTRQAIFGSEKASVETRPKVCKQISNSEVILFGQAGKKQQFAKITFE